jgi:hypothetical protein
MPTLGRRDFLRRVGQCAGVLGSSYLTRRSPLAKLASRGTGDVGLAAFPALVLPPVAQRPKLIEGSLRGSAIDWPLQTLPAQCAALTSARRSNIFTRGEDQIVFDLGGATSSGLELPTDLEVLDAAGQAVFVGKVVSARVTLGEAASWQLGWYRLRLFGTKIDPLYGNSCGGATFVVADRSPNFPSVPSYAAPPSAVDVLEDGQDFVMRALVDAGCARLSIGDAANPRSQALGFLRNVEFDQRWWRSPAIADPLRPREHFVAFPNGAFTPSQLDGVTETVRLMYPHVKWFEGPINEPDDVMSPTACATAMTAFAAAVKRGHPKAKVLGPGLVTVNNSAISYWEAFFEAGGGARLDGVSSHLYNCFLGDPWLGDAAMGQFVSLLARHGVAHLPRWATEGGGDLNTDYGSYRGRRQLHWSITRLLQQERYGFTKERAYYFYDSSHGYWDQPSWLQGQQPGQLAEDLQPIAGAMRTLSEVLRGTRFDSELEFGTAAPALRGYVFRGPAKSTLALFTSGSATLPIALRISGSVAVVDTFGNPVVADRSGSLVQLTISDLPTYLLLDAGAAIKPADVGNGLMGAGRNLARQAVPTTNGSSANLAKVTAGSQFSAYLDNQDLGPGSPWYDTSGTFPIHLMLSWNSPHRVKRAVIYFAPPWHQSSAPVRFRFETLNSGRGETWTTRFGYHNGTAKSEPFTDTVTGCTRETFYDENWVFNIVMPHAVSTRAVRITVLETTFGGSPDIGTYTLCANNQGGKPRLFVRSFEVYGA